jgi:GxxExxY protein
MMENEIGTAAIGAALKVHTAMGPGLLESAHRHCMQIELESRRLNVSKEVPVAVRYADREIPGAYRIDLLVDERVVVELKAVEHVSDVHRAQVLSHIKLGKYKLGYLLNFRVAHMRNGISRYVNGL